MAMFMPKQNQIAIYEILFKEGIMVTKKDVHMPKYPELANKNVPKLHVKKAMQSLRLWEGALCLDIFLLLPYK
jgi:small subunit ribosomal protein S10e